MVLVAIVACDIAFGVAAVYIGVSIAYGHRMIRWSDERFAHRFANGPAPVPLYGSAYTRKCWADVGRTALAVVIAGAILLGLIVFVGDPDRTSAFDGFFGILAIVFIVDLIVAISYTLSPRREPRRQAET